MFSLPQGVVADGEFGIDQLVWHGGVIGQVRAAARLDGGALTLSRATAQLPGGAGISVAGILTSRDGRPAFDAQVRAAAENFRAVLDWLKVDVAQVPEGKLRHFTLDAKLAAAGDELKIVDMDVVLDATRARGGLTARLGSRPAFGASLAADAIDLDSYLAKPKPKAQVLARTEDRPPATAPGTHAPPSAVQAPPSSPAVAPIPWLTTFDANLRLKLGQLVWHEVSATGLFVDAGLADGDLTLRDTGIGDLGGASVKLEGTVAQVGSGNPRAQKVAFDVRSGHPARLFRFFGLSSPIPPERLGGLALTGTMDGDGTALAVRAHVATAGLEVGVDGTVAAPLAGASFKGRLNAHASSFAQVARLFSESYRPRGVGTFSLSGTVAADAGAVDIAELEAKAGEATLGGHAHVALGGKPVVTAQLAGNAIVLDQFLAAERTGRLLLPLPGGLHGPGGAVPGPREAVVPAALSSGEAHWSRAPFDLSGLSAMDATVTFSAKVLALQGWRLDDAAADFVVADGAARLDKLTGRLLGGTLAGNVRLSGGGVPVLAGNLTIAGANVKDLKLGTGDLRVAKGLLSADAKWSASGRSSLDMIQAPAGSGRLEVRDGVVEGFDLPAVNERLQHVENIGSMLGLVQGGLNHGSTRFSALTGTFNADKGILVTRDLKLEADGGGATGEASIDLPRYTMDARFGFKLANSSAPPLTLRLEGPLEAPRKIIDVNELQRYMVERGLGRALSGKGGGLIEALTGRKPKDAAPATPDQGQPETQKPPKAADVLRGLFKGLAR